MILDTAYAKLGLTPEVFWNLTWREFSLLCDNYIMREHNEWSRIRWIGALYHNMNVKEGARKHPYQLMPLPLDPKQTAVSSVDDIKMLYKRWKLKERWKLVSPKR